MEKNLTQGQFIKQKRNDALISQSQLAKDIGRGDGRGEGRLDKGQLFIHRIEKGVTHLSIEDAKKIAKRLKFSVSKLISLNP